MLGDVFKTLREERGLTQVRLAEISGVSVEAIWAIEHNRTSPRFDTLQFLADALGVKLAEIIERSGE